MHDVDRSGETCAEWLVDRVGERVQFVTTSWIMHASREPTPPRYIRRCQTRYSEPGLYLYGHIGSSGGDLYGRSIYIYTHTLLHVEPARCSPLFVCRDSSNRVEIYIHIYMYVRFADQVKERRDVYKWRAGGIHRQCTSFGTRAGNCRCVWPRRRYIHRRIARRWPRCVRCFAFTRWGSQKRKRRHRSTRRAPERACASFSAPDNDHTGYWDASFCSYSCNWNSSPSLRHVAAFHRKFTRATWIHFLSFDKEGIYPRFLNAMKCHLFSFSFCAHSFVSIYI